MKRKLSVFAVLFASLAQVAFATTLKEQSKVEFAAPIVTTHTTLPSDTPFGSIIYDYTAGSFMGLDSSGTWEKMSNFSGANTSLSNLSATAVNTDILPATNDSISLGNNAGHEFNSVAAGCATFANSAVKIGTCTPDAVSVLTDRIHSLDAGTDILLAGGYIQLNTNVGGGTTVMTNRHFQYTGNVPSVVCNANAGSTATCALSHAKDPAGIITITTGGTGIAAGDQADINFVVYFTHAPPICTVTPANLTAGINAVQYYVTTSSSGLSINFANPSAGAATYVYHYSCFETQ